MSTMNHEIEGVEVIERVTPISTPASNASQRDLDQPSVTRMTSDGESWTLADIDPITLARVETARTQHNRTVGASDVEKTSSEPIPSMGAGKRFPDLPTSGEDYLVEFDGEDDMAYPENWSIGKKLSVSLTLGLITLTVTLGSSLYSPAIPFVAEHFEVSTVVGILGISLYVLGFALGPILWGPLSELQGRKLPILVASFTFAIFQIAAATSKDLQTLFICRFFAGISGSCHLTVVAAVLSDMFDNRQRGLAIAAFTTVVFAGTLVAPFIGGFVVTNPTLGWRWTQYIVAIMAFAGFAFALLFLEETFPPAIMTQKARKLRIRTRNWAIHARQEEVEIDISKLVRRNFLRPLQMLVTEPIVLMLSVYMAFIYALLYLFLTFYPIVFQETYGMSRGVSGLPYIGMLAGLIAAGLCIALESPRYNKKLRANHDVPIPEWRLPLSIFGGVCYAIGLFWFGWTGYDASVHWMVPTASGLLTGFGLLAVFLPCFNYLVDSYLTFAASAIAANTLFRSICGAVFPLFARYLIEDLGVQWAGTLLGGIALLLVPVPFLFWRQGASIRSKSRFAVQ